MTLRNATYFPQRFRFAYDRGNERLDVTPGAAIGKILYEGGDAIEPAERVRLLSLAGVDRVIAYGGDGVAGLVEAARLVGESNIPVVILRNDDALPRAHVVHRVEIRADPEAAFGRLRDADFDPSRVVILEEGAAPAAVDPAGRPPSSARLLEETSTDLRFAVSAASPGYLVLHDTYYPGWEATVDGEPAPIRRANVMFRAVAVDAGEHEVRFVYRPSSVRNGVVASAAAAVLALLLGWPRRR